MTHRTASPMYLGRVLSAAALVAGGLVLGITAPQSASAAPGPIVEPALSVVTADALPTVQINGVVWSQAIVGNTVYVGGEFTQARPAGAASGVNTVTRNNLLAFDLTTGELIASFNPNVNGLVKTVVASPTGDRVYIGGGFTSVGGVSRSRIAAFTTSNNQLDTTFAAGLDYTVSAIAVSPDNQVVYVGGSFSSANGNARSRLAAFRAVNGALTAWNPGASAQVLGLVVTPDGSRVIAGGSFTTLAGAANYGMGAISAANGTSQPWAATNLIRNAGQNAAIFGLTTNGNRVFGWGYQFGSGGNFEGTFSADPATGSIDWIEDCHGDTYGAFATATTVYTVGHAHYCGNLGAFGQTSPWNFNRAVAFTTNTTGTLYADPMGYFNYGDRPSPSLVNWFPDLDPGSFTGLSQAAWSVTGNSQYVVLGGEFPSVNDRPQQGLVRFAVRPIAPADRAPELRGANFVPKVVGLAPGAVRVSIRANWDMDQSILNYRIQRQGSPATTLFNQDITSQFWNRPSLSVIDQGLTPGQTYQYRAIAMDPDQNTSTGDWVTITAPGGSVNSYADRVLRDGAANYWQLNEPAGTIVNDTAGTNVATASAGVTRNTAGAISGDAASTFGGTSIGFIVASSQVYAPNTFSVEAWFRTSTTSGGKIVGFGNSQTGNSGQNDRHLYMDNAGRILFGAFPGQTRTLTSSPGLNNNQWHHVVGTLGSDGMKLYVDGSLVGQRMDTTSGQPIGGYWRIGGDNLGGWPNSPSSGYFAGSIDDVALYSSVLSAATVQAHNTVGRGGVPGNATPTASFTSSANNLVASFNAAGSSDPDGTITAYSWDFGDNTTPGTGVQPTHTYAAAGTYTVGLTVTDNGGAQGSTTRQITVSTPPTNQPPSASFAATSTNLFLAVDASASQDLDGTITSYAWDFGDGATGSGVTTTHAYPAAGTYTVTLIVTDNASTSATTIRFVTVSAGPPAVVAADTFERTVAGGFGNADIGGAWSVSGGNANFSVGGGAGHIRMNPGSTVGATLGAVAARDMAVQVAMSLDRPMTGGGVFTWISARKQSAANNEYRCRVKFVAGGSVQVSLARLVGGSETTFSSVNVPNLTYNPGESLKVKFQTVGAGTTTLGVKVWRSTDAEPTAWLLNATDSSPVLQNPGSVGLISYLSSGSTDFPVTGTYDDLSVRAIAGP